jgi:2-polyprenyl-3-methyl-5-hydroxy-6-metoxy-1,4-benzoquinol methylase
MITSLVTEHVGKERFTLLDFGCGAGELTEQLAGLPGAEVVGMDYSAEAVKLANGRGCKAVKGRVPDKEYDCIVCSEVLQTSENGRAFLRRLAASAPLLIVSVPNNCYPRSVEPANQFVYSFADLETIAPCEIVDKRPVNDRLIVVFKKE